MDLYVYFIMNFNQIDIIIIILLLFSLEGIARLFWVMSQFLVKSCG
jgi:hypothetical protein